MRVIYVALRPERLIVFKFLMLSSEHKELLSNHVNKAWLTQYYSFCIESTIQLRNALVLERFRIVFTENSSFGMKFRNGQVFSKMKEPCLILIHFLSVSSRYRETS